MADAGAPTPIRDGFAAIQHEPALVAAEITWRWCFGISAIAVVIVSVGLFLNSLKVSKLDELLLSSFQPQLLARAFRDIFRGSLSRLLLLEAVLLLGLTALWSFASAVGRTATLRRLLEMFGSMEEAEPWPVEWRLRPIFLLELLRAAWIQIWVAVAFALLVYGGAMAAAQRPFAAALALSFGVGLVCVIGLSVDWYLWLAPLFCLRNGVSTGEAVELAATFSAQRRGRLGMIGLAFFVLRLTWAAAMAAAFLGPLSLSGSLSPTWIAVLMGAVVLAYLAGASLLRLAKWGAYVSLVEDYCRPVPPSISLPKPVPPPDLLPLQGLA